MNLSEYEDLFQDIVNRTSIAKNAESFSIQKMGDLNVHAGIWSLMYSVRCVHPGLDLQDDKTSLIVLVVAKGTHMEFVVQYSTVLPEGTETGSTYTFHRPMEGALQLTRVVENGPQCEWMFGALMAAYKAWEDWYGYNDKYRPKPKAIEGSYEPEWIV